MGTSFMLQLVIILGLAGVMETHAQLTSLLSGTFETFGDVSQWANLALDLADIRKAKDASDRVLMQEIYTVGKNAKYTDADNVIHNRTLASLSLEFKKDMMDDPMFGFFVHSFAVIGVMLEDEDEGFFDDEPVREYANTLVMDLLSSDKLEATPDAVISVNVWMFIVHQLYDIARACQRNDDSSDADMKNALDIAAALWIGAGQEKDDNDTGNMLYNLAEQASYHFGQEEDGEALMNKKVVDSLLEIKSRIKNGFCKQDTQTAYKTLRYDTRILIGYMTVPLVQTLLHHVLERATTETSDYIELYALSIAPRVQACQPAAFSEMLSLFVVEDFDDSKEGDAIVLIQKVYPCLEIDCTMVGEYRTGDIPKCEETISEKVSFAGYVQSFETRNASRIDRDIEQIRILTKLRSYVAAYDIYQHGYNSLTPENGFLSLQDLATSPYRANTSMQFDLFSTYYENRTYGDERIVAMFYQEGDFIGASTAQTSELITRTLTNVIMYMAVLEKAFGALNECNADRVDPSIVLLDQAVVFYVGSMEGQDLAGMDGGRLLFGLAKEQCVPFGTCGDKDNFPLSQQVIKFFITTSDALTEGACQDAERILLNEIAPALLVPLVQGTLNYAHITSKLDLETVDGSLGAGNSFAYSILPLIEAANPESAITIHDNMKFSLIDKPVSDGPDYVFQAIKNAIPLMKIPPLNLTCEAIGQFKETNYTDVCEGADAPPTTIPTSAPNTPLQTIPTSAPIAEDPTFTASPAAFISPVMVRIAGFNLTQLGLGRYNFVNDVSGVAGIALDVRDMGQQTVAEANRTYVEGGNAQDETGRKIVSLAKLSQTAALEMDQDPMFNIYRWALLNESVYEKKFLDADFDPLESAYADVIVNKALNVAGDPKLAAETAVVMSIWMEICHELNNAIVYCEDLNPDMAVLSVDRSVALWIGSGVSEENDGYLMYDLAQRGEEFFGLKDAEARANTEIIASFVDLQTIALQCQKDHTKFLKMKVVVADILKYMSIPLLQHLFYHISQGDVNRMKLFALAIVPQSIGCGASGYVELRNVLLSDLDFDPKNVDANFYAAIKRFQSCLRISCTDIQGDLSPPGTIPAIMEDGCVVIDTSNTKLAGFAVVNDVYELSRIDLDILHITIFKETNAKEAAIDYYENGFNSRGTDHPLSLKSLATSEGRNSVEQFEIFKTYYAGDDYYADSLVLAALQSDAEFKGATRDQVAEASSRALQCLVLYMAVLEKFYNAIDLCEKNVDATRTWEEGVALFVGSLEGTEDGGNGAWDGTTLYSLAKETCDAFGTCEGNGNAYINEVILSALEDGRDLLIDSDCQGARDLIADEILGDLPVSLVQGVLFYTYDNAGLGADDTKGAESYTLASAYVLAQSVLPLVSAVNKTSSQTIANNTEFNMNEKPVPDGADSVLEAMTFVLTGMDVDCLDIGSFEENVVCNAALVRPVSDTPTNLGDGIYITTTYVDDRAKIATDLMQIRDALQDNKIELARDIYRDGENSKVYDEDGIEIGRRSLQKFSTEESSVMTNEPVFNIFRHGLQDENGQYLGKDVRIYGDSIVIQAFGNVEEDDKSLPAEAMLAVNLWMYLVHQLFETLDKCKNNLIADTDGVHSIDEAVAYWIGDAQLAGDSKGHLFYALAESISEKFNTMNSGQAIANSKILNLFNQAKKELSSPDACSPNAETYPRLRQIVYGILAQMIVPLMQSLINNLRVNDTPRVKLYAQAVAPLTAACNPDLFEFLSGKLIYGTYNAVEVEDIVARLRSSFECLGLSCDDIGQHVTETDNICVSISSRSPFAGYIPNTDVREYAQLDLDILEAGILMDMEAYSAVEDIYTYGAHSTVDGINGKTLLTLSHLATTSDRSVVPQFESFVSYFNDNKYADTMIRAAIDVTKLTNASKSQRKEIVITTMQFLVTYMGAMQALYDSIAGCQSGDASRMVGAHEAWDRAAALLIGSIEGSNDGGEQNGQFIFALAKERCAEFNTCGTEGFSEVNEELVSLLYTGRGEVEAKSCAALLRTAKNIESLLLVPLIQSTLRFANENAKLDAFTDGGFAAGYVFARSVLPYVHSVNSNAADTIERNMDFQFERKPVIDGSLTVFDAFAEVYTALNVACEKVGTLEGIDSCTAVQSESASAPSSLSGGAIAAIVISVLAVVGIGVYMFYRRTKKEEQEQAPIFRRSNKGVMDHDSDLVGGDASVVDGDEAFDRPLQIEADSMSMT